MTLMELSCTNPSGTIVFPVDHHLHPIWELLVNGVNKKVTLTKYDGAEYVYELHGCPSCARAHTDTMMPSHNGSSYCESGSIASGGTRSHCTCSWCY